MAVTVYENDSRLNWINAGWVVATNYNVHDALLWNGTSYRCIVAHTAAAATEPGVGANWATVWIVVAAKGAGTPGTTKYNVSYSRTGAATVTTGKLRWAAPAACTITQIRATIGTAPVGADLIVDVNKNGVTIFTTQTNRPKILAGAFDSGLVTNMEVTALAAGDYLTVDIDQIGTTTAGSDVTIEIFVTEP